MRSSLGGWILAPLAACAVASAADPPAPPSPEHLCPAIDEDFQLCAGDPMSGNCARFVADATTLAQLYQIQAADSPQRAPELLSSNWWGCGDATLTDMKALLASLGSPGALALLRQEPFTRLAPPALAPAPPPAPPVAPDCEDAPTSAEQDACAASELAAAQGAYRTALAACQAAVAPALRDSLTLAEQTWPAERDALCNAEALDYEEPRLQRFARSVCVARATRERTRAMLAAHPECAAPR
jgi:uncharacterized protein YecT (DUF1311 family)